LPNKDGVLNIGSLEAKIIPRTDEEDNIKEKLGPLGFKPLTFFESRDTKETAQRAASWPFGKEHQLAEVAFGSRRSHRRE